MKKLLFIAGVLCAPIVFAQDISDALRYSQDNIQGSARYRALSGAFGALGGDVSAMSINPAGSAIFNTSHISLTLSYANLKNKTSYFNGLDNSSSSVIDLNQTGAVFVFDNRNPNAVMKKFTLGVAYDKLKDYDDDWFANGVNTNNSIDSYFLGYANGLRLDEISALPGESYSDAYAEIGSLYGYSNQQAYLGYESYILEPASGNNDNTVYGSNIGNGDYYHEYSYAATGYNGKFTINTATQIGDKFYLGVNLNSHFINYERFTNLYETNANSGTVSQVNFGNNLITTGSGFSFQIGGIMKVTEGLRAGLTYNSPTWYSIDEEGSQYISTIRDDSGSNVSQIINPQTINIFPNYKLTNPGKFTGSLAYIFGNHGLISFDYSIKDYSNTKFRPKSDEYFSRQNAIIQNSLTTASTYKIGGEYRFRQLSFRAGYRFEESPYKNETNIGELKGYSLGLGYSFGSLVKLDLTFDQFQREDANSLYSVGLTDAAFVDNKTSNVSLSLSFNL
ncbi:OmpP1/FadL family transporter [Corallibacter sp.]|uniref:OmpP1/FadL family transporter n=1 Tax=Corallibacter sp. TaxID=2038084 RepID=UPI003AB150BE